MEPPRVTVSIGYTRNMENFESLRVDIGIEDSKRENEANTTETFNRLYKFVEEKLVEKMAEIEAEMRGVAKKKKV